MFAMYSTRSDIVQIYLNSVLKYTGELISFANGTVLLVAGNSWEIG